MSQRTRSRAGAVSRRSHAPVFAALGDETRLLLLAKLSGARLLSISQLTVGTQLSRQAITKHLRVLEQAGLVHGSRAGRESLFELDPAPLSEARTYLDLVSEQWDEALGNLKTFVEK